MQKLLGNTPGIRLENIADAQAQPEGAEGIDGFGKRAPIICDERRIDGAGGNTRQDGDAKVGETAGETAQETHLVGRVRASSA